MTREGSNSGGGLSVQTLLISSLAAVAAAVVVPLFWERGSLIATAITPVIVAIVSEALKKPAEVITSATPRVTRRTGTGVAVRSHQPAGIGARGEGPERLPDRGDAKGGGISPEDPFGLRAAHAPRRRFPVRLAVGTGLLAAVIGAGVVTASELAIFGHSVGSSGHRTSLWGGSTHKSKTNKAKPEQASPTATPRATSTATATSTPSATPTPTASATPSPEKATPTPSPSARAPAPTTTP